jgi:hypothetical protein
MARSPKAPETAQPTFSLEDPAIKEAIAQAVAAAQAEKADKPSASNKSAQNEWRAKKAFAKKGLDAKPHENILTFAKWLALGRRVKEGERAVAIGALRLFHISQTREATEAELVDAKAKALEAANRKASKVIPINQQPQA